MSRDADSPWTTLLMAASLGALYLVMGVALVGWWTAR